MPFKSQAQRRMMWARHPEVARRWTSKYGAGGNLPERLADAKRRAAREAARKRKGHAGKASR